MTQISQKFITIENKKIHVETIQPTTTIDNKDTPCLVFLHEGLGSIAQWRDFPHLVCEQTGLTGIVYERFNYAHSSFLPTVRTMDYMHDEALVYLSQVLDACDIKKSILVGHSDGGSIGLIFAAHYPEYVQALITEAAHVFVEEITLEGIKEAEIFFKTHNLIEKLARYHGDNAEQVFYNWFNIWMAPEFKQWNIEVFLPNIYAPVLAIQGLQDEYGTEEQVDAIVEQVSGEAEKCMVDNCQHVPHHQAKEVVLARMVAFIKQQTIAL